MSFRFLDLCNVIRANLQFCHQQLAVLVVVTFFKTKKIRFDKHEQRYDRNAWMVISFSVSTNVIVDLSYSEFSGALHHIFFC